jgi:hypothetical protein
MLWCKCERPVKMRIIKKWKPLSVSVNSDLSGQSMTMAGQIEEMEIRCDHCDAVIGEMDQRGLTHTGVTLDTPTHYLELCYDCVRQAVQIAWPELKPCA